MKEIIIEGEKGRTFHIDLEDPIQKRYEMVRELKLSSKKREEICKKYGYTRKTGNEYLNAWVGLQLKIPLEFFIRRGRLIYREDKSLS
jgi:hypothetical protein